MRVLPARDNGRKEDRSGKEATAYARADHPQAARSPTECSPRASRSPRWRRRSRSPRTPFTAGEQPTAALKADDVKRLKELERENSQLKWIVADKELENLALREISKGNF